MDKTLFDICIIGGGVNGAGIARDAAGRGYKVLLLEQKDLASATSSNSTKLVHGGLRYLEQYEFRLVRESLLERARLLKIAPHIIWPMQFILPHEDKVRPFWFIRLGVFLYDLLAFHGFRPSAFQTSKGLNLENSKYGEPLKIRNRKAISYEDAWVDDARLVVLNAISAQEKGATIKTYSPCTSLKVHDKIWHIESGNEQFKAKMLINTAGPWVREILEDNHLTNSLTPNIRLVKGSHIIVPKLYEGTQAYILQQIDKRIVFAIPYEGKFTLIGTTEENFKGSAYDAEISSGEKNYLLDIVQKNFNRNIKTEDIIHTYSGVRALYEENIIKESRTTTRDYKFHIEKFNDTPLLSVFGGKITTYRALAEHALEYVDSIFHKTTKNWTDSESLKGGQQSPQNFLENLYQNFPQFKKEFIYSLAYRYGTKIEDILIEPFEFIADGVLKSELDYTIQNELVKTSDDFLWRRTKYGLHLNTDEQNKIKKYFGEIE